MNVTLRNVTFRNTPHPKRIEPDSILVVSPYGLPYIRLMVRPSPVTIF